MQQGQAVWMGVLPRENEGSVTVNTGGARETGKMQQGRAGWMGVLPRENEGAVTVNTGGARETGKMQQNAPLHPNWMQDPPDAPLPPGYHTS